MFIKKYFEEYNLHAVLELPGRTITETDIVIHAGQTGDFYPHHMNEEWCKTQPFKKRIAHGTLIFSIAVGMTAYLINEAAITYGFEHLRFIKPVFIGDTLSVKTIIKKKNIYKKPAFGLLVEAIKVTNQHEQLVMVCDHLLLVQNKLAENNG